jgi:hypothetical protein
MGVGGAGKHGSECVEMVTLCLGWKRKEAGEPNLIQKLLLIIHVLSGWHQQKLNHVHVHPSLSSLSLSFPNTYFFHNDMHQT